MILEEKGTPLDVLVFSVDVLEEVNNCTQDPVDRVHVSYYIFE